MSETHGNPSDHGAHAAPALAEPKTPMWLPAVGALLFLAVILTWTLLPSSEGTAGAPATTTGATADAGAH